MLPDINALFDATNEQQSLPPGTNVDSVAADEDGAANDEELQWQLGPSVDAAKRKQLISSNMQFYPDVCFRTSSTSDAAKKGISSFSLCLAVGVSDQPGDANQCLARGSRTLKFWELAL